MCIYICLYIIYMQILCICKYICIICIYGYACMFMYIYSHIFMQKYIYVNNIGMHTRGMFQSCSGTSLKFHAA